MIAVRSSRRPPSDASRSRSRTSSTATRCGSPAFLPGDGLVRLTGIDAPETGDGRTTRECFGPEARQWLRERAPAGTRLDLVLDVGERDRFGRVLAYAYRADGAFLNADLVSNGYARTMTIRPNVRHAKELQALERRARSERRGLWGACPEGRR